MKEYYEIKKVSNSSLSWFQKSPKYFKAMLDGEITEPSKSYFEKGEMIHQYLLEPDEFVKNYTFLAYATPTSQQQKDFCKSYAHKKIGSEDERLLAAYRESYSTKESDEKVLEKAKILANDYKAYIKSIKISYMYVAILPPEMETTLSTIKSNIVNHQKANELLFNQEHATFGNTKDLFIGNEFPIYWTSPNGVECKSLLDRLIIDFKNKKIILVDLKTTSHITEFKEKFVEYKYYRQMAFYWMALYWHFKANYPEEKWEEYQQETYIVAISTDNLSEIKVFNVSDPSLNMGLDEIIPLLELIKWHSAENKWDYTKAYYDGNLCETL